MKNNKVLFGSAALLVGGLFAFNTYNASSIRGTIMPADAGTRAWALSATDTLKASIMQGQYSIQDAKPGTYRIIIEGKPPYKNAAKDGVRVIDGQATEVGEIKLEQ